MFRPLIIIKRFPTIDFMRWHLAGFVLSGLLTIGSLGLFLVQGLNYGIDFIGGTLIEVRTQGPADLAQMRSALDTLDLVTVQLQGFGGPSEVLIRLQRQPGDDKAQQQAVTKV